MDTNYFVTDAFIIRKILQQFQNTEVYPIPNRDKGAWYIPEMVDFIQQTVESMRNKCKVVPAYGRQFNIALGLEQAAANEAEKIPNELIAWYITNIQPGTSSDTVGARPRVVKPIPIGERNPTYDPIRGKLLQTHIQPVDGYIDFDFWARDSKTVWELVDWFYGISVEIILPILRIFGVQAYEWNEGGFDEYIKTIHPHITVPRMRYRVRFQRVFIDYAQVIKSIYLQVIDSTFSDHINEV